jgi:peroxiredoxin
MIVLWLCLWLAGVSRAQSPVSGTSEKASDFTYTRASGKQGTLYALRSEWILLYFYDPTCEDCHALMEQLNASERLNRLIEKKRIQVLAVYPEEDTAVWLEQAEHVPQTWINGYDKGAVIHTQGLYLMTSLPTLYLLDRDKNIRLKTATADEVENALKLISNK